MGCQWAFRGGLQPVVVAVVFAVLVAFLGGCYSEPAELAFKADTL
jgi:hypothetical protein